MEYILTKVSAFVLIIIISYLLKRGGFFKPKDFKLISNIVLKLTLPCAVISNFNRISVEATLFELVLIGILCNLVTIGIGYLMAWRKSKDEKAFNMINYSGYNIGCFTMPYIQTFLRPDCVVATCLFDAGNSVLCTGATYSMAAAVAGKGEKSTIGVFFRRMFSSIAMDVYILMVLLATINFKLPNGVIAFTDTVGAANAFLAMMMIGIGFEVHFSKEKLFKIGQVLLHRYLIAVGLAWLFFNYAPFDYDVRKILTIIAFAPVSAVCAIFTEKCEGDVALSCTINSLTIAISIVCMTTIMINL